MNRERAKELLPIIQAFAEGKDAQWKDQSEPTWNDSRDDESFIGNYDYRIKPEPFECWVNIYNTGSHIAWNSEEEALSVEKFGEVVRTAHLREVE